MPFKMRYSISAELSSIRPGTLKLDANNSELSATLVPIIQTSGSGGSSEIDDNVIAATSVWSSQKTDAEITVASDTILQGSTFIDEIAAQQIIGSDVVVLSGTVIALNMSAGTRFEITPTGDATITVNPAGMTLGDTREAKCIVEIVNTGGHAITWASAPGVELRTAGGNQPSVPVAGQTGIYTLAKKNDTVVDLWLTQTNVTGLSNDPVASNLIATVLDETSASLVMDVNKNDGDIFAVVINIATGTLDPDEQQIIDGVDGAGALPAWEHNQGISQNGTQTFAGGVNGLIDGETYRPYAVYRDGNSVVSNIVTGADFIPRDVTPPIPSSLDLSELGANNWSGTVNTNTGEGEIDVVITTSATPPNATQIKAGEDHTGAPATDRIENQAVSASGVQNLTGNSTLATATEHWGHAVHTDAAGNISDVLSVAASFTTTAGAAPTVTVAPTISGTPEVGLELTGTDGVYAGDPAPTVGNYQWQRSDDGSTGWTDISGATSANYTLVLADADKYIRREEIATNIIGFVTTQTAASAQVTNAVTQRSNVVVIGIGQSLAAGRGGFGNIVQSTSGAAIATAYMANGGAHLSAFPFWASNPERSPRGNEWTSLATFAEGGEGQSPLAGITNTLTGYTNGVLHSAAIGARTLGALHTAFSQVQAAVERSVNLLVAQGETRDDIDIIFYMKHGEANAASGTSQADYEAVFAEYVFRCRLAARQALRDPAYSAKLHVSFPVQQKQLQADREIKKAILAQVDVLPDVFYGEIWSLPQNSDLIHPTQQSYVYMGEKIGHQISNGYAPMRCLSVTLNGSSFTATFNKPVVRDTSLGYYTSLNAANAVDGLEFWDGSAYVAVSNLVYAGNTITGDLASAPAGGELRIAVQDVLPDLTNDLTRRVGCAVRSTDAGWASTNNPSFTHYDWCIPQTVEVS